MMQAMMYVYGGFVALMILFVIILVAVIGVSRIIVAIRGKLEQRRAAAKVGDERAKSNPR